MLSYGEHNPPPKSRITNKRVPFPLCSTLTTKSQPMSSINPLVPTQTVLVPDETLNPPSNDQEASLPVLDTARKLSNYIKKEQDRQIFLDLWNENKFSSNCKDHIELLYKYIEQKDTKNVINIKEKLLADFKDLCDSWLTSIEI